MAKVHGVGKATAVTDIEKQKHDVKHMDPCDNWQRQKNRKYTDAMK